MPCANEYPMVNFTINNIYCELYKSGIDFEIIVIDNWCEEMGKQKVEREVNGEMIHVSRGRDKTKETLSHISPKHPFVKYIEFPDKFGHWNAKNAGIAASTGKILWFVDAHCIVSKNALVNLYRTYIDNYEIINGTLHLPLGYMLERPGKELLYKFCHRPAKHDWHYTFTSYGSVQKLQSPTAAWWPVPVMSTCGMMMSRTIYEELGGWPKELGIYGGGENFINFTLAVLGRQVNILPGLPLYHYADKRGYNWNYTDYHRNRIVSTWLFAGKHHAMAYMDELRGNYDVWQKVWKGLLESESLRAHHAHLQPLKKMSIEDWTAQWEFEEHPTDKGLFMAMRKK